MLYLAVTFQMLVAAMAERVHTTMTTDPERGSETIEKVIWGAAVILIVGIVVAAIRAFVTTEAAKIR